MPPLSDKRPEIGLPHRRDALRLLAAGMTAALAGCGKPEEEIVPYVRMPERLIPGEAVRYATALPLSGYGRGVLVTAVDGRPIKVEGNPRHPASGGATDVFAEADILGLYDPDRSRTILHEGRIASREAYMATLGPALASLAATRGRGLRLLTARIASPTLQRQLDGILSAYPAATWHVHEPMGEAQSREGARLAFGRPLMALPRLADARTILALDADPLGPGPDSMRLAHGFAAARRPADGMARLYAVEAEPTLTGAKADHRVALPPDAIGEAAVFLANRLGAALRPARLPAGAEAVMAAASRDLEAGAGLLLAGEALPPAIHALVHWINARLAAPLDLIEPVDRIGTRDPAGLADLTAALDRGEVEMLVVLGTNPVYDAPGALGFADRMGKARLRIHAGLYQDETAQRATWHLPVSHPLESWSDLAAPDGTVAIVQPLIRPLYATRRPCIRHRWQTFYGDFTADDTGHRLVRDTWRRAGDRATSSSGLATRCWKTASFPDTRRAPATGLRCQYFRRLPQVTPRCGHPSGRRHAAGHRAACGPEPVGRWLRPTTPGCRNCPKPLTKEVWGNSLSRIERRRRGPASYR